MKFAGRAAIGMEDHAIDVGPATAGRGGDLDGIAG